MRLPLLLSVCAERNVCVCRETPTDPDGYETVRGGVMRYAKQPRKKSYPYLLWISTAGRCILPGTRWRSRSRCSSSSSNSMQQHVATEQDEDLGSRAVNNRQQRCFARYSDLLIMQASKQATPRRRARTRSFVCCCCRRFREHYTSYVVHTEQGSTTYRT